MLTHEISLPVFVACSQLGRRLSNLSVGLFNIYQMFSCLIPSIFQHVLNIELFCPVYQMHSPALLDKHTFCDFIQILAIKTRLRTEDQQKTNTWPFLTSHSGFETWVYPCLTLLFRKGNASIFLYNREAGIAYGMSSLDEESLQYS